MKYIVRFAVAALFFLGSSSFGAGPEPQRPRFDNQSVEPLVKRAAYAAFLGDACSISNSIPEQFRKFVKVFFSTPNDQQLAVTEFSSKKSTFASDASSIGILKRCHLDGGKTRSLVNDVGRELEDRYQTTSGQISAYELNHARWESEVQREREQYERELKERQIAEAAQAQEKIKSQAESLSETLGKAVVQNAYQGGQTIGTRLVSYDWSQSDSTYRLKVEIKWNGIISGDAGYGADGVITVKLDSSERWVYGKNYQWNPSWQSSKLNEWISYRGILRLMQ